MLIHSLNVQVKDTLDYNILNIFFFFNFLYLFLKVCDRNKLKEIIIINNQIIGT